MNKNNISHAQKIPDLHSASFLNHQSLLPPLRTRKRIKHLFDWDLFAVEYLLHYLSSDWSLLIQAWTNISSTSRGAFVVNEDLLVHSVVRSLVRSVLKYNGHTDGRDTTKTTLQKRAYSIYKLQTQSQDKVLRLCDVVRLQINVYRLDKVMKEHESFSFKEEIQIRLSSIGLQATNSITGRPTKRYKTPLYKNVRSLATYVHDIVKSFNINRVRIPSLVS